MIDVVTAAASWLAGWLVIREGAADKGPTTMSSFLSPCHSEAILDNAPQLFRETKKSLHPPPVCRSVGPGLGRSHVATSADFISQLLLPSPTQSERTNPVLVFPANETKELLQDVGNLPH